MLGQTTASLLRAMRPSHWLKNGFVFAPAVFSGHAFEPPALLGVAATASLFCLASSAAYLINDVADRQADRLDPVKRHRPVAAGQLSVATALVASVVLAGVSVTLGVLLGGLVALALVAYLVLNLVYSLGLKRVPILEAMVLATGFLLRLVAGAVVIPVVVSHWLLICGFLLATLLAFGKRVPEVSHPAARTPRYPASFLTETVTLLAGVTVVAYVLYTVAGDTVARFGSHHMLLTAPIVLFGVLRYLFLLSGSGAQDPTAALLGDRWLLAAVLLWALVAALIAAYSGGGG